MNNLLDPSNSTALKVLSRNCPLCLGEGVVKTFMYNQSCDIFGNPEHLWVECPCCNGNRIIHYCEGSDYDYVTDKVLDLWEKFCEEAIRYFGIYEINGSWLYCEVPTQESYISLKTYKKIISEETF